MKIEELLNQIQYSANLDQVLHVYHQPKDTLEE